ncbi:NELlike 1 (Silurana), partial [Caligus rogercresseyi]
DGVVGEVYTLLPQECSKFLLQYGQSMETRGSLPRALTKGRIVLIPKKEMGLISMIGGQSR